MPGYRNSLRVFGWAAGEISRALAMACRRLIFPVRCAPGPDEPWHRKPGLGIMYQIEYRPGMDWDRDYQDFNRSMMDENGKLKFNGPFCRIEKWVALSEDVGVDYHVFQSKWHDGICYFRTELTDWKTEVDYCGRFAELSREAGIPFMFYYSAIFDHNPLFDPVQPDPHSTFSVLSMDPQPVYEEYLRGQYRELVEQYRPDGMWIDWYWTDRATELTLDLFRANYPDTVLTFNLSNYFPSSYHRLDYTSGEAHDLEGFYLKPVKAGAMILPIFTGAWRWATLFRRVADHPWELVTPVGKFWQDPTPREDPYELLRMAAVILGSGGKFCVGTIARLDGELHPDQVKQLKMLGAWYKPRKNLFTDSVPLRYRGQQVPGIRISPPSVRSMACIHGGDTLLHLVNVDGVTRPITVEFRGRRWGNISAIYLEPAGKELEVERGGRGARLVIRPEDIDPVDIILRLRTA